MADETKNEVGVFGKKTSMVGAAALQQALATSASTGGTAGPIDGSYANFSGKRGVYEIGVDKRDTPKDEMWMVNSASFEDGYVCWKGGQPMATRLYPMGTTLPTLDRTEHGPFTKDGDGWFDAKAVVMKSLDNDEQIYFKINSISGVNAMAGLQREILAQIAAGKPYWPVVNLHKSSFTSKGFKNFLPVFNIVGWLSDEAVQTLGTEGDDTSMAELFAMSDPTAPKVGKAEEVKKEEPAPVVRRRRAL